MTFEIAARLKPFSHRPGTTCVIPGTSTVVQVFPTLLRYKDLMTGKSWEETLDWKGPVEGFTVELDSTSLEVFGKTADGFRRKQLGQPFKRPLERLSLGKHTKLDWDLVLRRMDMEEMAPVLFQLGQLVPETTAKTPILNFLEFKDKRDVVPQLISFFKTGFQGMLAPRLTDDDFQGIVESGPTSGCALALLSEGYQAIRSLLFTEADGFSLLPNLPPEFHAGRLLDLRSSSGDLISIEWSKKLLKKVVIKPALTRAVSLTIQKSLTSFRINKKVRHDVKNSLSLIAGEILFLDRFEK